MISLNPSISAPNIASEYDPEKTLLTPKKNPRITFAKSQNFKNDSVDGIRVAETEPILQQAENGLFSKRNVKNPLLKSYKHSISEVSYSDTYIWKKERNRGLNCFRSEINSYRRTRRRTILKNGDGNVVQVHISQRKRRYLQDIFTTLVDAQWRWTLLIFAMSFLLSWSAFGGMWWLISYVHGDLTLQNLTNETRVPCVTNINGFISSFLFSVEAQHTIGFGNRYPTEECHIAIALFCIQNIIGVMIQAFMVGIIFAKMARPKQRKQTILFSRNCVICQRNGQLCLMFRVGDMREKSHLINANIRLYLVDSKNTQEGELLTPYLYDLSVQIDDYKNGVLLIWPITVVHIINAKSPLYEMSAAELIYEHFELIAILEGTTESTGQTTQVRTSFLPAEILWGYRFQPLIKYNKEKLYYEVNYESFHDTYQVETPLHSAKELQRYFRKS